MAKAKAKAKAQETGGLVQLKDTSGSFYDPETDFQLTRDEVKELSLPIGRLTAQFKQFGHLVEVEAEEAAE